MSPYERAVAVYQSEPCSRTFLEDLHDHLRNGFVFCRPDFFIMGRPVVSTAPAPQIIDPRHKFPSSLCDCWHVYLMAGNMAKAWTILPWELPLFSFERKNELRFYLAETIARLSGKPRQSP